MPMRPHSPIAALSNRLLQSRFFTRNGTTRSTLQAADALPQLTGDYKPLGS
jgi:hypothetical protein